MEPLERSPNDWEECWENWNSEDESRQSKLCNGWGRAEYWGVSWRSEKTSCYTDSSERPSANTGVKTLKKEHIAAQNNAVRTNHIKARIDKTQQNSKCRLCGDRHETINHIISECSKLAQKEYKTRHDWVGKVIHWEMCKKFKFDHTNKWYMHNPAPVLENNTHKFLWDFDILTDHLVSARRLALIIIKKKKKKENLQNCGLCCPGWPQNKTKRMWKEG